MVTQIELNVELEFKTFRPSGLNIVCLQNLVFVSMSSLSMLADSIALYSKLLHIGKLFIQPVRVPLVVVSKIIKNPAE